MGLNAYHALKSPVRVRHFRLDSNTVVDGDTGTVGSSTADKNSEWGSIRSLHWERYGRSYSEHLAIEPTGLRYEKLPCSGYVRPARTIANICQKTVVMC